MPETHRRHAVDVQSAEDGSCLAATRALLKWRNANHALRCGDLELLPTDDPLVMIRRIDAKNGGGAFGAFNLSDAPLKFDASPMRPLKPVRLAGFSPIGDGNSIELPPFGACFAESPAR
jgi:glycosidase